LQYAPPAFFLSSHNGNEIPPVARKRNATNKTLTPDQRTPLPFFKNMAIVIFSATALLVGLARFSKSFLRGGEKRCFSDSRFWQCQSQRQSQFLVSILLSASRRGCSNFSKSQPLDRFPSDVLSERGEEEGRKSIPPAGLHGVPGIFTDKRGKKI
jgi:hypothetical protein